MKVILIGCSVLMMVVATHADQISVAVTPGGLNAKDANLHASNGFNDDNGEMFIGGSGSLEVLFRFDLPALPDGSVVTGATLQIFLNAEASVPLTINAHALLRDWSEGNVTWEDYDVSSAWTTPGGLDTGTDIEAAASGTLVLSGAGSYKDMDITTQYQQWYNGTEDNFGLLLLATDLGVTDFARIGDVNGGANPVLVVDFFVPEPGSLGLAMGGFLMLMRRWGRKANPA